MMKRRGLLIAAGAASFAALAGATWRWRSQVSPSPYVELIKNAFGDEISRLPTVQAFLSDYEKVYHSDLQVSKRSGLKAMLGNWGGNEDDEKDPRRSDRAQQKMLKFFLQSTNVVNFSLGNERTFVYEGLFTPYEMACMNRLSAQWLITG